MRAAKLSRENATVYEMNLLRRDQFDRKVREVEFRARNLRRRREREALWKGSRAAKPSGARGATIEELLRRQRSSGPRPARRPPAVEGGGPRKARVRGKARPEKKGQATSIGSPSSGGGASRGGSPLRGTLEGAPLADLSNTCKLEMVKDDGRKAVLRLFYAQSKRLLAEMRARVESISETLKAYMERLENILEGSPRDKYLGEERGSPANALFREQREKYAKLALVTGLEKRFGPAGLFREVARGGGSVDAAQCQRSLALCEALSEAGGLTREKRARGNARGETRGGAAARRVRDCVPGVQGAPRGRLARKPDVPGGDFPPRRANRKGRRPSRGRLGRLFRGTRGEVEVRAPKGH